MNVLFFVFFYFATIFIVKGKVSKYQIHKKTNGFDYRPCAKESSPLQVYRISKYFTKKRLLDTLQNQQISIHEKMRLLTNNELSPSNLFAGGLMKDFLFDMDEYPIQHLNKN